MSEENSIIPPAVLWGQNDEFIIVKFRVDCKNPTIIMEPKKMYFKGVGEKEQKQYEVTINFYGEIDPDNSVQNAQEGFYKVLLAKKVSRPFWPNLTNKRRKPEWLKIDFNTYRDDDDAEEGDVHLQDAEEMIKTILNPMKNNTSEKPNFDDLESDSEDENLPDLE